MTDGTRPIFWLNMLLLIAAAILAILGKWDWVVTVAIGLVIGNLFSGLGKKRS